MTERQAFGPVRLETKGLAVGRGETVLLRALYLAVEAGTGLLLRGPNGAGKSTLLLTLAGLLPPVEGTVAIGGHDGEDGPAIHHCGHRNAVRGRLSLGETLKFWAAINGATGLVPEAALERVGLGALEEVDAGLLSAGQQRRLALARLLVTRRPIWLLDEPTASLDASGRTLLGSLLADHLAAGGLAVIATHDDIPVPGFSTLTFGAPA
jgi:heme exporter protein A